MAEIININDGLLKLGFYKSGSLQPEPQDGKADLCPLQTLAQKMECYIKELRLFNSAYDLVNTDDRDEIIVNHIFDSLSAVPVILRLAKSLQAEKNKIIIGDIGSGAGLPGIPLAAALPNAQFVLIERMSKRCAFLQNCAAILDLKNVCIKNIEAERMQPESLDIAVFRAFKPLDKKILSTVMSTVVPGGFAAAYKAKKEKIAEEMKGLSDSIKDYSVEKLFVPYLTDAEGNKKRERNLVVIKKN
ncbi:16S rRNA (guanine(527)-N(7))-methyltransferase RsmG [Treponema parvum]|uniref:16S rRNA (guanine(527)-N(7))-methyltransferase RsmG n=1 Tax=Treponema parvum TaxID=138851 RepID=UPI001AEC1A11|nr:16S rRNA (guanine(527)-N(7))-methyltransferase RsmG [Treponema parvum]QTQ17012.1 16S rRNA (guanine(527)-N(7))-methyltransferase RsmG [Treponema parvum]